jgi:glycosyltransferase involved in cell wall biosynthesis
MTLRILDLGCHDGFVGAWLMEKAKAEGLEVEIDGVELHPDACERARARGYRRVVRDLAETAPDHFDPGSYDAVVMFELIEHVSDPEGLLGVAENMLAPGGRVYVSTPDGTFGEGRNPHHLRALRAIDLSDILRRRGQVEAMGVGPDTITVASYTPAERRGEIAIFTGPSWLTWSPFDIETRGLGGSETAAIRLAQQLARLGYVATVYGDVQEGLHAGVLYRRWETFDPTERKVAIIASRLPQVFERPVNAQARLLWVHDVDCGDALTPAFAERIDRVLCLSKWHEQHLAGRYPFLTQAYKPRPAVDLRPPSKLVRTRNGIHLPYFQGEAGPRERRVLYTSSPDRGLDVILALWPQVKQRVPDAVLHYCSSPFYDEVADKDPRIAEHRELIRRLEKTTSGVVRRGSMSQPELSKLMRESLVWAHPSWATPYGGPFHETYCIGAIEAQAAGLHVVASAWGALAETVRVGELVTAEAQSDGWRQAFVDEIVRGLTDREAQEHAQEAGPEAVAELGWEGVARQVAGLVEGEVVECSGVAA